MEGISKVSLFYIYFSLGHRILVYILCIFIIRLDELMRLGLFYFQSLQLKLLE